VKVLLVDYGVGNLLSAARALAAAGGDVEVSGEPARIADARRVVLPGVGAFGGCMAELRARGLENPLRDFGASGRPMLGICVGMQILMTQGEEFGRHEGLGLVPGEVTRLADRDVEGKPIKLPHIGWSELVPPRTRNAWDRTICAGLPSAPSVYFLHSFAARPAAESDVLAEVSHGGRRVAAAIVRGAVFGTQFHPEKSGPIGLRILANFLALG
jgi:imidazole glycerol-phosphate synthase subunit HisH